MEINNKTFTIGADPEVFMGLGGKFVSAHDIIPGTKMEPYPVKGGAVQVDGMALEFNIDPASSLEEFQGNLQGVQGILKEMIGDHQFLEDVSVHFDQKFLNSVPTMNRELGCSPDYNGWTMDENPSPDVDSLMRTVGGHVHLGGESLSTDGDPYNSEHFEKCARLARILDSTVGLYSILWDTDDQRREMYGKAGSFRPKSYGMEYRTLSNKWIFDPKLVEFVWQGVRRGLQLFEDTSYEPSPKIREIIDQSRRDSDVFNCNLYAHKIKGVA